MSLNELAEAAASIGGTWVNLKNKGDLLEGRVISFEKRPKTFEGAPVLNRKTGEPRTEWVFTLDSGNGEYVKSSFNEAAQRAIGKAIADAGGKPKAGDTLKIAVNADPPDPRSQAEYRAKWTVGAELTIDDLAAPAEEPF